MLHAKETMGLNKLSDKFQNKFLYFAWATRLFEHVKQHSTELMICKSLVKSYLANQIEKKIQRSQMFNSNYTIFWNWFFEEYWCLFGWLCLVALKRPSRIGRVEGRNIVGKVEKDRCFFICPSLRHIKPYYVSRHICFILQSYNKECNSVWFNLNSVVKQNRHPWLNLLRREALSLVFIFSSGYVIGFSRLHNHARFQSLACTIASVWAR